MQRTLYSKVDGVTWLCDRAKADVTGLLVSACLGIVKLVRRILTRFMKIIGRFDVFVIRRSAVIDVCTGTCLARHALLAGAVCLS